MEDWRKRIKAAGLTQRQLAQILDMDESTISRQFRGERPIAGYVIAAILAWEIMDPNRRAEWIDRTSLGIDDP